MKILKTIFLALALYAVILTSVACDQNQIRKAAKASNQLSGLTLDAVRATKQAYLDGMITLEQKDRIADKLLILATGGQTFNQAVKRMAASSEAMTPGKWQALERLFDAQVIVPFLAFLAQTAGAANAAKLSAAIGLIRLSVLTIAQVFGRRQAAARRINESSGQLAERFPPTEEMIYA